MTPKLDTMTIAEIVASDYRTADVFKKHHIDFCCGGKVNLISICEKKELDFEQIKSDLENIEKNITTIPDYNHWEGDKLIYYIQDKHHRYIQTNIPIIREYAQKVVLVHGHHRPELVEISRLFEEAAAELISHMAKEEEILFPYGLQLYAAHRLQVSIPVPKFGSASRPIDVMETEHDNAGNIFKEIDSLSHNFTPPTEACNTYRVWYAKLKEFEDDLHLHVHLENNILFPKIIMLEKQVIFQANYS